MLSSSSGVPRDVRRWGVGCLLWGGLALGGCDGSGSAHGLHSPVPEMVSRVTRPSEHSACAGGAVVAESGFDWNGDGALDADEVEHTEVLCDDEPGSCTIEEDDTTTTISCPGHAPVDIEKEPPNGDDWLVVITPNAPTDECPAGGYTVRGGRDIVEPKGVLDEGEVETTSYACHAHCGDEAVDEGLGEECDDGNDAAGDGCDARCRIEPSCAPPTPDPACPEVSYFVDSLSPVLVPTAGGTLTLRGVFPEGASADDVVATWVPSGVALEVASSSSEEILVDVPAGVGAGTIELEVAGWPISYLARELGLDGSWTISVEAQVSVQYAPPTLHDVSGCTDVGSSTTECPPGGGTVLTLDGSQLGSAAEEIQVTVGGQSCGSVTVLTPHSQISCVLPARGEQSFDLPVHVTVGGQSSSSGPATGPVVSYEGPSVLGGTLSVDGIPPAGDAHVPDTAGGNEVVLHARALGTVLPEDVSVHFEQGTYQVPCAVTALTSLSGADVRLECTLAPGVGANLAPVVTALGIASRPGADRLHRPAPALHPGTLRLDPLGAGALALMGTRSSGEDVYFDASHVGADPTALVVTYGPPEQPDLHTCEAVDVDGTTVRCRTAFGSGGPHVFSVRTPGGAVGTGTDEFTYPAAPVLTSVGGCLDAGSSTTQCPTRGGLTLTLQGSDFGPDAEVRVGSAACTGVEHAGAGTLTCTLPPGVGDAQVTIEEGSLRSNSMGLHYAPPVVTAVSGCAVDTGNTTSGCPTEGGVTIVVDGENFGPSGANVLIGSSSCSSVQHWPEAPHERLSCQLPAGAGLNQMLRVVNGGVSTPFAIHYATP